MTYNKLNQIDCEANSVKVLAKLYNSNSELENAISQLLSEGRIKGYSVWSEKIIIASYDFEVYVIFSQSFEELKQLYSVSICDLYEFEKALKASAEFI